MSIWVAMMIASFWYLLGFAIDRARQRYFPAASDEGVLLTWFFFLIAPIGLVAFAV